MRARSAISYRDPHGFVLKKDGTYFRYVDHSYKQQYDHLLNSGLYDVLVSEKLITPFTEVAANEFSDAYKILLPQQIDFLSYPYEWCFNQWLACVKVFFKINKLCLKHNMILKDATPFNFCWQDGGFKMFDILSFEFYKEGDPWIAYRQFCENFLGPISLMKYNYPDWGRLYSAAINGFDLQFVSKNLPFKSWFNGSCLLHIHLHATVKNKPAKQGLSQETYFKKERLKALWDGLAAGISKWKLRSDEISLWVEYYEKDIQTQNYLSLKENTFNRWLKEIEPDSVLDIGANTGKFSVIAAKYAKKVIALESDHHSLNNLYLLCKSHPAIVPLLGDLANPYPGLGWLNEEKQPLLPRLQNNTILALAVIHHLRITYNIPLQLIADLFYQVADKYLVLEFVGKGDEKVKAMLAHRDDIYQDYSAQNVKEIFSTTFKLIEEIVLLPNERIIYLWEKQ